MLAFERCRKVDIPVADVAENYTLLADIIKEPPELCQQNNHDFLIRYNFDVVMMKLTAQGLIFILKCTP